MATRKFVDIYKTNFKGNLCDYLTASWSNGASKSTILISMATYLEMLNFGSITTLSDPNRSIMPNFVEISPEMAEEISAIVE